MKQSIIFVTILMLVTAGLMAAKTHGPAFKHYVTAQEALAADNFQAAKKALTNMANECTTDFKETIKNAADAPNIAEMRKAFKPLSDKVASMGAPEGYGIAFCPMADHNKGGYWVQKKGDISNPYFGSSMLRCGSFKEYKKTK